MALNRADNAVDKELVQQVLDDEDGKLSATEWRKIHRGRGENRSKNEASGGGHGISEQTQPGIARHDNGPCGLEEPVPVDDVTLLQVMDDTLSFNELLNFFTAVGRIARTCFYKSIRRSSPFATVVLSLRLGGR